MLFGVATPLSFAVSFYFSHILQTLQCCVFLWEGPVSSLVHPRTSTFYFLETGNSCKFACNALPTKAHQNMVAQHCISLGGIPDADGGYAALFRVR